jgi:hypothetical protein
MSKQSFSAMRRVNGVYVAAPAFMLAHAIIEMSI